jgi:hypothetical protein
MQEGLFKNQLKSNYNRYFNKKPAQNNAWDYKLADQIRIDNWMKYLNRVCPSFLRSSLFIGNE